MSNTVLSPAAAPAAAHSSAAAPAVSAPRASVSLRGADGMRALACLMVMAHHAFQRLALPAMPEWFQPIQWFLLQGSAGVSVFFVLSGFLLATPFWSAWLDGAKMPSLRDYALRRAARIMPGYYLNILLTFTLSLVLIGDVYQPLVRLAAGLTFTAGFSWVTFFPVEINGPLWSIGFEVFAYLLLPLFMFAMFRLPRFRAKRTAAAGLAWWGGVLVLVIAVNEIVNQVFATDEVMKGWQYGMVGGAKYWMPHYNPWGFFGHYSLGILAAGANVAWQRRLAARDTAAGAPRGSRLAEALVWTGLAAMAAILWFCRNLPEFGFSIGSQPYFFPAFPLAAAVVLASLPQSRLAWKLWDNPVSRFIATISFGLYIWHYLFMELIAGADYRYFGMEDPVAWASRTAIAFTAAVIVATLSWKFLEKPIVDRARGKVRKAAAPAA